MREIHLTTSYEDKSLETDNKILGNQGDNGITKIYVDFGENFPQELTYKYLCIKNNDYNVFWVVDISNVDFIVSDFYSWKPSLEYRLLIFASDTVMTSEDIQRDASNWASDELKEMEIRPNFLDEPFEIRPNEEAE